MQLEFAFLCDAATESGGKLYALGIGIDRLQVTALPARHARMTLVARLVVEPDEQGTHPFELRFVDADGRDVTTPVNGTLSVQVGTGAPSSRLNVLIDVVNAEFHDRGPHELTLSLGGNELVVLPLDVVVAGG